MRAYKRLISAIAVLLFMSGCAAGPNATTKMQGPSGSGDYARIGEIYIQNIVIVKGTRKDERCVFAESFYIQSNKIYCKLAELKTEKLDKETKTE